MEIKYDAIVIGSGLSGLSAAVSLAQKKKKVAVIEKHTKPGGYATSFKSKGFTFEVSLHQVPGLKEGAHLFAILAAMGIMNKIQPIELDRTFDVRFSKGTIAMGKNYLEDLKKYFPEKKEAIVKIEFLIGRIIKELAVSRKLALLPDPLFRCMCFLLTPTLYRYRNSSLSDLLDEITKNNELR
jgi:all-trans-retinol 13,14-reductase